MNITIDFPDLPAEVTDYAFDQFNDRIDTELDTALESVFANECVEFDYESQSITLYKTVITTILETAMREKVRDIEYEVEHGERDDYSIDDVQTIRTAVNQTFENNEK